MQRRALSTVIALALLAGCKRQPDLAHRVQDRLHAKVPAAKVDIKDPSTLEVSLGDQKVTVSLDNVAVICENEPAACDENIDRLVQGLAQIGQPPKPVAADELRVMLRSTQTVEANRQEIAKRSAADKLTDNQLVTFPFLGDMTLVLVRDLPNGIALMNHGALGTLQLDDAKARDVGTANLGKALTSLPTEPAAPGVFRVRGDDNYDAARILLPKLWDALAKQVSGDLLVVAPTRDIVFATGSNNAVALATMNALAKKAFDTGPYALSLAVLRRTDAGFVLASAP